MRWVLKTAIRVGLVTLPVSVICTSYHLPWQVQASICALIGIAIAEYDIRHEEKP
jgi:hypothetical protein